MFLQAKGVRDSSTGLNLPLQVVDLFRHVVHFHGVTRHHSLHALPVEPFELVHLRGKSQRCGGAKGLTYE